ncbi:hypothetical protein KCU77_g3457, partial [Aureobasidium melanogenum]
MKVFANILAIATIAAAAATPNQKRTGNIEMRRSTSLCGPLDTPMCCETDVLGVADLSCTSVPNTIVTDANFTSYCAGEGKTAECCVTSLLDTVGLLCSAPAS